MDSFRSSIRAWLASNCPAGVIGSGQIPEGGSKAPISSDEKVWLERCAKEGYTVPMWPKEYGGAGLTKDEYLVLVEEMKALNARSPIQGIGVSLIGPTLLEFGTEDQKKRHLPRIASGEIRWCQGYSEPGAGSDLASLNTRAELDGDRFVINGQKIWTSGANYADWMFCLVRTDPGAPKHEGISMVLLDMNQPGVTTRLITLISGETLFCETFFDNVIAHKDDLVGALNRGWSIGKRLLQHERSGMIFLVGGAAKSEDPAAEYRRLIERYEPDQAIVDQVIAHDMRARAHQSTLRRTLEELDDGRTPGLQTFAMELVAAEVDKEEGNVRALIAGTAGVGWEGEGFSPGELALCRHWLSIKRRSIARGSNEIQMNIIAKRVLGLPD